MKVLLDTCVIVDVLQRREPYCKSTNEIFILAANNMFTTGCISAKSVTHRLTHNDKVAKVILDKLFSLFEVIDTDGIDCKKAMLSHVKDYEDAVMIETALRLKMDYIVTRNVSGFEKSTITVCSPQEFLEKLKGEIF